jgi:AcrR family transcriptional regulator
VADIAAEADYGHGTFYMYFTSKEEVFKEIVLQVQDAMAAPPPSRPASDEPWTQIEFANRQYFRAYRENANIMATLEQAVTINPEIRELRVQTRERFVRRNSRAITRWQAAGLADPTVDATYAAQCLGAMVDRAVYFWLVFDEPYEEELAVRTLTLLWAQALGVPIPASQRAELVNGTGTASPAAAPAGPPAAP